ncbi:ATP-grasp domain-containing protein [Terrimonas sp. NA20]|uniref:ATP-grasp domain-containing protein n=1 Tax=Terrimonas ginsenosidimutans TaxID=2908004 RepID=A0ABS9KP21_9BACT|nr:ATP-grasp domain-containing protein [Terrimonas ginsenosidimutans]MCG2614077.1 ATP-grasp domain-containing protein [Terrimonas ginsenosidimutans]
MSEKVLLIPEKADSETHEVAAAWAKFGRPVRKLGKYWIKEDDLNGQLLTVYGNQTFSLILAQIYDLELISPDDSLIANLDQRWTKRNIKLSEAGKVSHSSFPVFIKPVVHKQFQAAIFISPAELQKAVEGLPENEPVLVSEIIPVIRAEARAYIMDNTICDIAFYEGSGNQQQAILFLESFLRTNAEDGTWPRRPKDLSPSACQLVTMFHSLRSRPTLDDQRTTKRRTNDD